MPLERYREVIPDWTDFIAAVSSPEPTALRLRDGLPASQGVPARLSAQGFQLAPLPSLPGVFQVKSGPGSVAQTLEHWLGLFHVQQAVMGLPSLGLAPEPGERVLDLCAAPGGKTAHLAELMRDRGPLVAVDPKEKRLRGLQANVYRLGHPNVLVVAADGRTLPDSALFDRVLVDAPCSAEGNIRRQKGRLPPRTPDFVAYVTTLQEALLRRAVRLTRPGGVIVYATCTFAPEENEVILDRILRTEPVRMERIPVRAPHAPGLPAWEGVRFHPDVAMAWRVYPHHLDSGGLFMARLRRLEDDGSEASPERDDRGWTPVPAAFPGSDPVSASVRVERAITELSSWFSSPGPLPPEAGWMVRGDNIWSHTAGRWPVASWRRESPNERWRVVSLGLRAFRGGTGGRETPSNYFLVRWGAHLSEARRIALQEPELLSLLHGRPLPVPERPPGFVALEWEGMVLGRGLLTDGTLRHEIPRASAERLRALLLEDTY